MISKNWRIVSNGKYETPSIRCDGKETPNLYEVCRIKDIPGSTMDNTRLIVKSPELYEGLKMACKWLDNIRKYSPEAKNILLNTMPESDKGLIYLAQILAEVQK